MKEIEFQNEIAEIQKFMWLNNWDIQYRIIDIEQDDERWEVNAQIETILYDYFKAVISFDKGLLKEDSNAIIHVIFHELSHIYTSNTIELFENEREFLVHYIWNSSYVEFKNKFNFVNEQQTELLARRFKSLYLNKEKWLITN